MQSKLAKPTGDIIKTSLVPLTRNYILDAAPILNQLKIDPVETHLIVDNALGDTATALGFKMDHDQRRLITEDIIKKYSYDSIEDVLSALETIRQGNVKVYKLNMVTIAEAMSERLEQKAEDRERALEQEKQPRADATEGQLRAMGVIHTGGLINRIKQALQKIRGRRV